MSSAARGVSAAASSAAGYVGRGAIRMSQAAPPLENIQRGIAQSGVNIAASSLRLRDGALHTSGVAAHYVADTAGPVVAGAIVMSAAVPERLGLRNTEIPLPAHANRIQMENAQREHAFF